MAEGRTREAGSVALDPDGYEALRRATRTHRERLLVRLGGRVGLQPAEMVRVRPGDLTARVHDGAVHWFLRVRDEDRRESYLPGSVARAIQRYARSNAIDDDEPLFDVTPRRVQMLVSDVAKRAATESGREELARVSTAELRAYHARSLLQQGVDPRVVRAVGGWRRLDSLPTRPDPSAEQVAAAFDRTDQGPRARGGPFRAAVERVERSLALLDGGGTVTYANPQFVAEFDGVDPVGQELRDLLAGVDGRTYGAMWEAATAGEAWTGDVELAVEDAPRRRLRLSALGSAGDERYLASVVSPELAPSVDASERTLARLDAVTEAMATVDEVLADASTREGVLGEVCEAVAGSPAYEFAWVGDSPVDGARQPRVWAGVDETEIERIARADADVVQELVGRAIRDCTVRTAVVGAGEERQPRSLAAVPLIHGETEYGAIVVAGERTNQLGDHERAILDALGGRVGHALAAVEWKRLLLAATVLELEFRSEDDDSVLVSTSAALDSTLRVEGLVPLEGDALLAYVVVSGAAPECALDHASESVENARLIADYSDESLLEVTLGGDSLAGRLVERGGNVQSLVAERGTARITCEFAPTTDVRALVEQIADGSPAADFVAKREVERSARTPMEYQQTLEERLTGRQQAVLQAAYHAGYFDWPRGSTAEELADSMGVSSPTLHNHLRRAERKLLAAFFDDEDR